jgi:hypothetical protein
MSNQLIVTWPGEVQYFELLEGDEVHTIEDNVYVNGVRGDHDGTVADFFNIRSWKIVPEEDHG